GKHQYMVYGSTDGRSWQVVVDKSQNQKDVPHDYVELASPVKFRYLKLENLHMPTGKFAISGFRVFGKGAGEKPEPVRNFVALRSSRERDGNRFVSWLKWQQNPLADGYHIYFGKDPGKLYGSIMVYGANEHYFTGMDRFDTYYFQIEAFNENGISPRTDVIRVE
ncbi:MAG TPA: xylosidase, partial [Verrucomicrobiales bacterium]|nr:xylosidase [Verrucomicrobiales bacterium]